MCPGARKMSLWNIFGGRGKEAEQNENAPPFGTGTVDMTTLDITYITHRLLGKSKQTAGCQARESVLLCVCVAAMQQCLPHLHVLWFQETCTQAGTQRRVACCVRV